MFSNIYVMPIPGTAYLSVGFFQTQIRHDYRRKWDSSTFDAGTGTGIHRWRCVRP